ncbi:DUF2075 domain-containing protein [Lysinibacillus xylanilyticus]|uniref:DUF2075 domain-containing protein n=1 Tax=Lysinibacillus xylanilyticus TaxID=582475 RepID=UPI002B24E153|nr:DUF2075 domain-containing protein [Lysinibacillus xylanilyticus]MEB2300433.1 DUF2075 domain-containing protein [Lysinibacillus xylanilyticus]
MNTVEINTWPFKEKSLKSINNKESYLNYPVIYLLKDQKEVYIGETVAFKNRMRAHLKTKERQKLDEMHLIHHEEFNRSATFHLETKLINYFLGDQKYKLQNKSQTVNNISHNYFNKKFYDRDIFKEIWQRLVDQGIVNNEQHVIENRDVFKLSPFKELSVEQLELKEKVIEICEQNISRSEEDKSFLFLIQGEAGTGKSVVLSSIFNTIQELSTDITSQLYGSENYLVVNHDEMLKTYKSIASKLKFLKAKNFDRPTPLINRLKKSVEKADIILVDEGHLLLTRPDTYNNFTDDNQLEELMKLAKIVIVVYDENQVLKLKSFWKAATLETLIQQSDYEKYELKNQFRMRANEEVIEWIDHFKNKEISPFPNDKEYELKIFDSLQAMHEAIIEKNNDGGLSRIVSTFDYLHKKDGGIYYITEDKGNYKIPWNITDGKYTWAEEKSTIKEAGSIYTVQGFDLNYVGVILGPSITYEKQSDCLVIKPENYKDIGAFAGIEGIENVKQAKEKIILNSMNVLMKRGIKGLYIYASDDALRERLLELQSENLKK